MTSKHAVYDHAYIVSSTESRNDVRLDVIMEMVRLLR